MNVENGVFCMSPLVGIMVVVIWVIPLEQFIAQLFGISFDEFGGGMQFFSVYQQDFMMLASATAAEESLI
jgi:hypothetical protein